jgi:hypothetical protein
MAGVTVEIKYFNTFVLKKTLSGQAVTNQPVWNGSFGIPSTETGGYPVISTPLSTNNWAIEESRIRGGFNNTTVDFSPKAYLVEDEPNAVIRFNSLIYSGIFNSRTGINDTNVFSVGADITKSADPANGSIQRLYAENTNLTVFQQFKVSRALIDKDAIYSAEGGGAVTAANLVIGTLQAYSGSFGISNNPESFATYGYRKYFTDKNNNAVLRLSRDGITEISNYGMKDFFRDELNSIDTNQGPGVAVGGYDLYTDQYVLSLHQSPVYNDERTISNKTVAFDDSINGWTSLFSYRPDQIFSIRNDFYSTIDSKLYKHHSTDVNRGNFYGTGYESSVTVIFNPEPVRSKTFSTISYEGGSGWKMTALASDATGEDYIDANWISTNDESNSVLSYYEGEYIINPANGQAVVRSNYNAVFGTVDPPYPRVHAGFDRKENAYVANLVNNSTAAQGEIIFGNVISGIKGFFATATFSTDSTTDPGGEKQLFSVATDFFSNNGY